MVEEASECASGRCSISSRAMCDASTFRAADFTFHMRLRLHTSNHKKDQTVSGGDAGMRKTDSS